MGEGVEWSACIAVPLAAPIRSHMQVHGAGITLSGLGVAIPMGLVSRGLTGAFGHMEWGGGRSGLLDQQCLQQLSACMKPHHAPQITRPSYLLDGRV